MNGSKSTKSIIFLFDMSRLQGCASAPSHCAKAFWQIFLQCHEHDSMVPFGIVGALCSTGPVVKLQTKPPLRQPLKSL